MCLNTKQENSNEQYVTQKNDISTYLEFFNQQIVSDAFIKKGLSGALFYSDTCKILYKAGHRRQRALS